MSNTTTFPSPAQPLQEGKLVNKLYYGDCLDIMRGFARESVDLIYLDPPFNSNRAYNVDAIKEPKNEQQRQRYEMSEKRGDANTYRLSSDLEHPHDVLQIHAINPKAKERVGYPTQKPLTLLKKLILASSNEGDVVFDPFCGCASTICVAHELKRLWIGIDIAIHAIKRVAKSRLQDKYRLIEGEHYVIEGIPRNIEGARDLWQRDHFQFQKWAIEQVEGFGTTRKTTDRGIDGRIYFRLKDFDGHSSMVIEVKGGKNINREVVGQLRGVMEREADSVMAGLIVLEELGTQKKANFMDEMAQAGQLNDGGRKYDKMQMLSIGEILNGRNFDTPYVEGKGERQKVLKVAE